MSLRDIVTKASTDVSKSTILTDKKDEIGENVDIVQSSQVVLGDMVIFSFYFLYGGITVYCKLNGLQIPSEKEFEDYISQLRMTVIPLNEYLKDKKDSISKFLKWFYEKT